VDAAGGSLREVLAVAGAPIEVWGDAVVTNRAALASSLDDVIDRLTALRALFAEEQALRERMRDLFAHGRACRERLRG
jgi:prephenate dehydrogenase